MKQNEPVKATKLTKKFLLHVGIYCSQTWHCDHGVVTISGQWLDTARHQGNTPNANMADHSVGIQDELHESEASEASVFCFDNASAEKSCFVDGLVCFISLCLLVFVFLTATRRDRNCPTFVSKGKHGSMEFTEMKEVSRRSPRELKFVRYIIRLEDLTKSFKDFAPIVSAHPYCARLRTQIHMPRHASNARAKY